MCRRFSSLVGPALRVGVSGLRRRLASERGFALPTVMLMTVAAMGVATVGVMTSIEGQSGVVRDQGTKTALEVAESGVNQALLYYNRGVSPCTAGEGAWCGPVTGMSVNGGGVSYWTRLGSGEACGVGNQVDCVEIVSQGTVNGVTRRVEVSASTVPTEESPGLGPFASAGVLSQESMTLDSNAVIHTGVATNGDITLNSNARQCGKASVGIGKKMTQEHNTGYYSDAACKSKESTYLQQALTLPPVNQGDAATNNDDGRLFSQDLVSGNKSDACWNGVNADGKKGTCGSRELRVEHNSSVTLSGSVYSFCKLTLLNNSALYVIAGKSVTIYFDSPEACGYSSGVTQLELAVQLADHLVQRQPDQRGDALRRLGNPVNQSPAQQQYLGRRIVRPELRRLRPALRSGAEQQRALLRGDCRQVGAHGLERRRLVSERLGKLQPAGARIAGNRGPLHALPLRRMLGGGSKSSRRGVLARCAGCGKRPRRSAAKSADSR